MTGEAGRRQGGNFLPLNRLKRNMPSSRLDRSSLRTRFGAKFVRNKIIFAVAIEMYTSIMYKSAY